MSYSKVHRRSCFTGRRAVRRRIASQRRRTQRAAGRRGGGTCRRRASLERRVLRRRRTGRRPYYRGTVPYRPYYPYYRPGISFGFYGAALRLPVRLRLSVRLWLRLSVRLRVRLRLPLRLRRRRPATWAPRTAAFASRARRATRRFSRTATTSGIVDDYDGTFQHLNLPAGVHEIEIRVAGPAADRRST